jgi:hypothetical protein
MADSAAYIQFLQNTRNAKMVAIVAVTALLWHHLNTFPQEVRFIWKHPLRVNSILFLSVRYLSIISFGYALFALTLFVCTLTEPLSSSFSLSRTFVLYP